MEFIADAVMEALIELLAEGFVAFTSSVFLHGRELSEKTLKIMRVVLTLIGCLLFVGIIAGIIMLAETKGKSAAGVILTGTGAACFLICVVLKLIFAKKNKDQRD